MNIAIWQKNPLFIHKLLNPFPVQIIVNWNMKMSTSSTLVSGMIEVGGGGSKVLKVPRASKQNPTKNLDQNFNNHPKKPHVVPVISG